MPIHAWTKNGLVIRSAHQLLQCCAVDALTRRHRPDSGVSPLMLGHRGRHSYGSEQQARGEADARTMLLQPASNRRILLCGPALVHPQPRTTRDQRPSQAHRTSGTPLRGTRGGTHAGAEGASRRPWRARWEGLHPQVGPPPGHSTWHPAPHLLAPPQPHLIDVYYLSHAFPRQMNHQQRKPTTPPTTTITATDMPAIAPVERALLFALDDVHLPPSRV